MKYVPQRHTDTEILNAYLLCVFVPLWRLLPEAA
jgi:hypothetical protein